jgi:uncharacterized damage-inducible protein DinB
MSRATRLANHIERTFTGPMWHGPALAEVLEGVTPERAAARPIDAAHSIWEVVGHVTAWAEIARERIHGESLGDPPADRDWPAPAGDWSTAIDRLAAAHRRLAADVRELTDAALDAKVETLDYPVGVLLDGVVEHGTYHAGQIALLKRAVGQP